MGYVKTFNSFNKAEEKKLEAGANPVMEEDTALLTDPALVAIQTNIRNLEKQLEAAKLQQDTKLAELRKKAADDAARARNTPAPAQPAAQPAAQPTQPA
jgi:hypothetical protein